MRKRKEFTNVLSQSLWCEVSVFLKSHYFLTQKVIYFVSLHWTLASLQTFLREEIKAGKYRLTYIT